MSSEASDSGRRTSRKGRSSASSDGTTSGTRKEGRVVKAGSVRAGSAGSKAASAGHSSGHDRAMSSDR